MYYHTPDVQNFYNVVPFNFIVTFEFLDAAQIIGPNVPKAMHDEHLFTNEAIR